MKKHRAILFTIALFAFSVHCVAQRPGFDPGQTSHSQFGNSGHENGSIAGTVRDMDNKPLKDVRVELMDTKRSVVSAVYTNSFGAFEFSNVPAGMYNVVATSGLNQASERLDMNAWTSNVNLRMDTSDAPHDGGSANSVSVAQYKVPGKARDEYRKARELMDKGRLDEAAKRLEKALLIYPDYADALTLRAILELNQKNSDAAVTDLDKALKADGNCAMAYMVMGSALNMQSKFDEALRALQHGESLAPNYWQAHFEMGKAYIGKADYPAALRELQRAQTMAPADYALVYLLQAHVLLSMKQYPEAMAALQAYLQKDPKDANIGEAHKMLEQAQAFMAKAK
ncbi:MAG TPA: tetratricopeptide repeat protein [Candidatus Angelobacter sp.]|nr:tetratricopeptide repeat protein [Candidatus Angelobacter sp.]